MESRFTPFMFCCCHCSLLIQKCWVLVRSCQRSQGFIPEQFFHTGLKIKAHQDRKCSIEKQIPFILSKKKKNHFSYYECCVADDLQKNRLFPPVRDNKAQDGFLYFLLWNLHSETLLLAKDILGYPKISPLASMKR